MEEKDEVKWKEDYLLVQKFIAGDRSSGEYLYEDLESFLFYYLKKQLEAFSVSREELEDLKQDVFGATLRDIEKYTGKSKFSTWVIGYARNFAYRKRQQLLRDNIHYQKLIMSYSLEFLDPSVLLLKKEMKDMVMENLEKLEKSTYQIFYLRFFQEKTFKEISSITEISYAEVLQQYRTGVISLKELIEPYFCTS